MILVLLLRKAIAPILFAIAGGEDVRFLTKFNVSDLCYVEFKYIAFMETLAVFYLIRS